MQCGIWCIRNDPSQVQGYLESRCNKLASHQLIEFRGVSTRGTVGTGNVRPSLQLATVMTKHSKNNTASSVFSYAEYKKLDYGTKRQRLGNESMRPFNACSLCLERARTPLACNEGHLFCTECVFTDLGTLLVSLPPRRLIADSAHTQNSVILML